MTRRRFYAPPDAFSADGKLVAVSADETRHLRDVLRLREGDEVYVFDGEGKEFRGVVAEIMQGSARVNIVEEVEPASRESPLHLTLAVALLKGEKFDLVVQKLTEIGVQLMIPIITSRADVKIKTAGEAERKVTRWRRIALEATKQCGRASLMEIDEPMPFAELVERTSPGEVLRLMFAERHGQPFATAIDSIEHPSSITAIVGSEGGWPDAEIEQARANDWKIVTLSGRTLRAETAAIAVAALLQHTFGDLK